jgi:hypothetical protein
MTPGAADHAQRNLGLASINARFFRHAGLSAAGGILRPMLGQIKLGVDEAGRLAVAERGKDTDLAVVDLAQPTIPLPGDANRVLTLFGETAFVDEKRPTPWGKRA